MIGKIPLSHKKDEMLNLRVCKGCAETATAILLGSVALQPDLTSTEVVWGEKLRISVI